MATLKTSIVGDSRGTVARVTRGGALVTTLSPTLGVENTITAVPFTTLLTVDGKPVSKGGQFNLNVNGSLTSPISAYVTGQQEGDWYITTANILIADSGVIALNKFGSRTALINGLDFFYDIPQGSRSFGLPIKSNFDLIRLSTLSEGIGGKNDSYQMSNVDSSNNDGYNPVLDLSRLSPFGLGIRIRQNSNDKLGFRIRDNLTAVVTFNVILTGYIRLIADN